MANKRKAHWYKRYPELRDEAQDEKLDGHIVTGPTGTNLNDLAFVLVY